MARVYDYGRFRSTGKRLIEKFGTDAELRRTGEGPWACSVVLADYSNRQVDGTRILGGDFMGYVPALGLATEPRGGDYLFWGDAEREVVTAKLIKPGPTAVVYILQLRGPR